MKRATDEGQAKTEGEICANDAPGVKRGEAEEGQGAECSGAGGGEAYLSADREHDEGKPPGRVGALRGFGGRAKMTVDVPRRGDGDHDAKCEIEPEIVGGIVSDSRKEKRAEDDAG